MKPNGPAIKFSRCYLVKHRPQDFIFSHKVVPVRDRYGAVFAVFALRSLGEGGPGTNCQGHTSFEPWPNRVSVRVSRYKRTKYLVLSHDAGTLNRALEQCCDTNLQWNRYWVRVHKIYWEQLRVSRFILFYLSVKKAGTVCKNCDSLSRAAGSLLILLSVL